MSGITLIGVDGGATEVKAHAVACEDLRAPASFSLLPQSASRIYGQLAGFTPIDVTEQLRQRDAGGIELSEGEIGQGELWIQAAAEAIGEVACACRAERVLVGMGMPGLKTADRRGICVINNGPRMPLYLDVLETALDKAGVRLAASISELGSDADYCGLGEEHASDGAFRDVENAYYVGCGTGVADAMKLRGELVRFDRAKSWIRKAWQMPSSLGPTYERLVSAKSINRVYAEWLGSRADGDAPFPEIAAAAGDPIAVAWLSTAALVLAQLVFERIWTIKNGRVKRPMLERDHESLNPDHAYRGVVLDRVVIGQRVGQIYADDRYKSVFGDPFDGCLASMIAESEDADLAQALLAAGNGGQRALRGSRLRPGFVVASQLRAAPALGAAVMAARSFADRTQ